MTSLPNYDVISKFAKYFRTDRGIEQDCSSIVNQNGSILGLIERYIKGLQGDGSKVREKLRQVG